MPGYIHHIEWCVRDLDSQVFTLVHHYGFSLVAERTVNLNDKYRVRQNVVRSGATVFVITEKGHLPDNTRFQQKYYSDKDQSVYPVLTCCGADKDHARDTVFNVCLAVGDVDTITANVRRLHGDKSVLRQPADLDNMLRCSIIKSCCGNVIHTLVSGGSSNQFDLPGFERSGVTRRQAGHWENSAVCTTTHMDHVTYVCEAGQSKFILKWYADIFGMKRFLVGPQEQLDDDGVSIGDEVGMRMTVGEWLSSWLCREEGVHFSDCTDPRLNFKLVLAEPLENRRDSHVQKFLDNHGGPGLQHIGLTTSNVTQTVQHMASSGARFRLPPPTYYQLEKKRLEIQSAGENSATFAELGLLLDSEADTEELGTDRFLIQIFTKPLFGSQDTFFLEVLERRGARGFGAGNITALAQSIILYQKQIANNQ